MTVRPPPRVALPPAISISDRASPAGSSSTSSGGSGPLMARPGVVEAIVVGVVVVAAGAGARVGVAGSSAGARSALMSGALPACRHGGSVLLPHPLVSEPTGNAAATAAAAAAVEETIVTKVLGGATRPRRETPEARRAEKRKERNKGVVCPVLITTCRRWRSRPRRRETMMTAIAPRTPASLNRPRCR